MSRAIAVSAVLPDDLDREIRDGEAITLIDVREDHEWRIARLPNATLIPLRTLPTAAGGLDREANVVVYCHHGSRSDLAARTLMVAGFTRVRNLIGGIDRWSLDVDPSIPRY